MNKTWDLVSKTDSVGEEEGIMVPSNFKNYTIQDQRIVTQSPNCERPTNPVESYDGPKEVKKIDLAQLGEEPKPMYIATNLQTQEEELLIKTLKQYRDVFAWSYKDLKGVEPSVCKHTIPMREDAKPRKQRPYTYNDTFAKNIKEEIDKLLEADFIYEIKHINWVSPIVRVPKKNGKLCVCVNLEQVNAATIRDNYPLPSTDHVIERVASKAAYSFLDGFFGYNQVSIDPKD